MNFTVSNHFGYSHNYSGIHLRSTVVTMNSSQYYTNFSPWKYHIILISIGKYMDERLILGNCTATGKLNCCKCNFFPISHSHLCDYLLIIMTYFH